MARRAAVQAFIEGTETAAAGGEATTKAADSATDATAGGGNDCSTSVIEYVPADKPDIVCLTTPAVPLQVAMN